MTPDRFKISDRAHLVFDLHQQVDALQEEKRLAVASVTPAGNLNANTLVTLSVKCVDCVLKAHLFDPFSH